MDNVLRKLRAAGVDFVRVGSARAVHPALHSHLVGRRAAALRVAAARRGSGGALRVTESVRWNPDYRYIISCESFSQ